ncbi:MAG: GntR family transcriptional regulator [bacterium]|nr:GntR family transcriptional regulator [Deltaproteobacteria bacterium]MCP4905859.1 GntR family transcriptional regulator [bacterium]
MPRSVENPNVTDRLRTDILSGEFAPGVRLIELQLTERYQVGRAPIRAAIIELDKEGLVIREANRGASVRSLSLGEAIEVYEVRAPLEGLMARHAARNASAGESEALRSLIPEMREAVEQDVTTTFPELGRALHDQISRIGNHRTALELIDTLRNQSRHHPDRLTSVPGRPQQSLAEHIAIVEAIANGQPDEAERAARQHIESIITTLVDA